MFPLEYVRRRRSELVQKNKRFKEDEQRNIKFHAKLAASCTPVESTLNECMEDCFLDTFTMCLSVDDNFNVTLCFITFKNTVKNLHFALNSGFGVIDYFIACSELPELKHYRYEITDENTALWTLVHPCDQIQVLGRILPEELARGVFSFLISAHV